MWSKIIEYKSQVVFEDLHWMQASLNRGLLLCARATVYASSWPTLKPLAARRGRRRAVASLTWPLMRNWHHGISQARRKYTVIRQWTPHNRTLSRGATRRKLRISSAGKNSLFYDPRISRPRTFTSRFCRKFCNLYASIYGTHNVT